MEVFFFTIWEFEYPLKATIISSTMELLLFSLYKSDLE